MKEAFFKVLSPATHREAAATWQCGSPTRFQARWSALTISHACAAQGERYLGLRKRLPRLIEVCTTYIEQHGLRAPLIFEKKANPLEVQRIVQMFEDHPTSVEMLQSCGLHAVAQTLLHHFRSMPEPIIRYKMYKQCVACNDIPNLADHARAVHTALQKLPALELDVFKLICLLLHRVSKHSDDNEMTPWRLATVWGPVLLQPLSDTPDCDDGPAVKFISLILERFQLLFSDLFVALPYQELDMPEFATEKQLQEKLRMEAVQNVPQNAFKLRAEQTLEFDLDYSTVDTPEKRFLFEETLRRDLSTALGVSMECFVIEDCKDLTAKI